MASHIVSLKSSAAGGQLARYGLAVAARAPPRSGRASPLGFPAGFLATKVGGKPRLAVVVAAAPGGNDDPPSADDRREAAQSAFKLEMHMFKVSRCHITFVASPEHLSMEATIEVAQYCTGLVLFLLGKEEVRPDVFKNLVIAGKAFLTVEGQAREGYMAVDAIVNGIQGIKLVGRTFFKDVYMFEKPVPMVPFSSDGLDKEAFFKDLVDLFIMYCNLVVMNAQAKYGYSTGGGI